MGSGDGSDGAGSDAIDKESVRERIWDNLEESGEARFPFPPHGRIPNFAGAKEAADRLAEQPEWTEATTIKANPDAPQLPVRRRALREGKTVYMAVPRLRDEECFLKLDPDKLEDYDAATTVSGSSKHGEQVGPEAVDRVDLIVSGSVAVSVDRGSTEIASSAERSSADSRAAKSFETAKPSRDDGSREAASKPPRDNGDSREPETGGRIGKGEGYSDLEYAVLRELDLVDETTPVATTVHERQVIDDPVAIGAHDVAMTLVVTPERALRPEASGQPDGIDWELLTAERLAEIPVLDRLDSS